VSEATLKAFSDFLRGSRSRKPVDARARSKRASGHWREISRTIGESVTRRRISRVLNGSRFKQASKKDRGLNASRLVPATPRPQICAPQFWDVGLGPKPPGCECEMDYDFLGFLMLWLIQPAIWIAQRSRL